MSAPTPSHVFLSTITCNTNLHTHINLHILKDCIANNPSYIIKNKIGNDYKFNFHNQLTFKKDNVNIKVFNNGQVVVVGCKNLEFAYSVVQSIIEFFPTYKEITFDDFSIKTRAIKRKITTILHNKNLKELFINILKHPRPSLSTTFPDTTNIYKLYETCPELVSYSFFLLYVYRTYFDYDEASKLVETNSPLPFQIPSPENFTTTAQLPCSVLPTIKLSVSDFKTSLIDCTFNSNFCLNRTEYASLLTKHGIVANLDLTSYQGINAKIFYPTNCKSPTHSYITLPNGKIKPTCKCHIITVLIFQYGTHIITGCNEWEQIFYAYKILTSILKKYYNILHSPHSLSTHTPDKIIKYYNGTEIVLLKKGITK